MGSNYSRSNDDDDDDDDDADQDADDEVHPDASQQLRPASAPNGIAAAARPPAVKLLEQEPEVLPCRAADSPLSPQPSAAGTPRLLAPGVRVWDPCHVLLPPPPSSASVPATEVMLISHGECAASLRPDLIGGRWPAAGLTAQGERQARALAVFLRSRGVRLGAVYSSPLNRARSTAALVCRELDFPEGQIQASEALVEMSHGQWEGCPRIDIHTPDVTALMETTQPDFLPPSGESLRQVQFRMIEFLNRTVLQLPEKLAMADTSAHQNEPRGFSRQSSSNSVQDGGPPWDVLYRINRPGLQRKKSAKSRLQFVASRDSDLDDELSPVDNHRQHQPEANDGNVGAAIGIFSHATPIKCLIAALLDCNPTVSNRICIDDSSVTVLEHSLKSGWQIKRMNDTAHLRLL